MGWAKPLYGIEEVKKTIKEVKDDDEKINDLIVKLNELLIKRAEDVKAFNEAIAKINFN